MIFPIPQTSHKPFGIFLTMLLIRYLVCLLSHFPRGDLWLIPTIEVISGFTIPIGTFSPHNVGKT